MGFQGIGDQKLLRSTSSKQKNGEDDKNPRPDKKLLSSVHDLSFFSGDRTSRFQYTIFQHKGIIDRKLDFNNHNMSISPVSRVIKGENSPEAAMAASGLMKSRGVACVSLECGFPLILKAALVHESIAALTADHPLTTV
jgi:hypothetical protein